MQYNIFNFKTHVYDYCYTRIQYQKTSYPVHSKHNNHYTQSSRVALHHHQNLKKIYIALINDAVCNYYLYKLKSVKTQ